MRVYLSRNIIILQNAIVDVLKLWWQSYVCYW